MNIFSFKPALPVIVATLTMLTACNEQRIEAVSTDQDTVELPNVTDEIAKAEVRIMNILLDEPGRTSTSERIGMMSHPGRDAMLRYLEGQSERSRGNLFDFDEEYEFSDEEEALIDDFLEARPDVDEAIALIVADFDAAFESLDQLPLEIEVTDDAGEVTGTELIYPEDGYYYMDGVTISALEVLHERQQTGLDRSRGEERSLGLWRSSKRLWKNRTVKYFIDSKNAGWSASKTVRNRVKSRFYLELNDLSQATGINFKQYKNSWWRRFRWRTSRSYVKVEFGDGRSDCSLACAIVGRTYKGFIHYNVTHRDLRFLQGASYSRMDDRLSTIHHELLHTLGMKHEHQRPDRDHHIRVGLVCNNGSRNCGTVDPNTYGTPYDYNSVMHYATGTDYCKIEDIIINPSHESRGCQFRSRNKVLYGTWLTPWDIYGVKYLYQVPNNPRPNYTPGTD